LNIKNFIEKTLNYKELVQNINPFHLKLKP